MDEVITYIVNDTRCALAIEELERGADPLKWVAENMELFYAVSYGGPDLPRIANGHYQGRRFDNIIRFHRIFLEKRYHNDDPF